MRVYSLKKQSWQKHIDFIVLDLICLWISLLGSYFFRAKTITGFWETQYCKTAVVILIISFIVSVFFESFKNILKKDVFEKCAATLKHAALVFVATAGYLYSAQQAEIYSRFVFYVSFVLYSFTGCITRICWAHYLVKSKKNTGKRSLLVVTVKSCLTNQDTYFQSNYGAYQIVGVAVLDVEMKGHSVRGIPVVAGKNDLLSYVSSQWIDEVFIDIPHDKDLSRTLIDRFNKMGVVTHARLTDERARPGKKQFVERMCGNVVLTTSINFATPGQLFLKRCIDIVGSLIGIAITALLYLILAPIIKLQSPGPVIFSQVRIGRNGKQFKMYKFRTMYLDAEERKKELMALNRVKDGHMFKLSFDPRIIGNKVLPDGTQKTGIMDLCRRLSLDEFPQFINVLKGEMSLVGTRPPTIDELETYAPHHHARLACKPGITGMWQVNGRSNITDFEEVVRLDMEYISEWTLGLDIRILFKTIAILLNKEGAM